MSELVAVVAEKLSGAPEDLVLRSATARAEALGVAVDEILAAWAGGASVAAAPAPAAETPVPEAPAATEEAPATEIPVAEPAPAPVAAVAVAPQPAPMVVVEEEELEPVVPAPLSDRVRFGLRVGAAVGAMLGVIGMVLSSPLILSRVGVAGESNEAAVAVAAGSTVITVGLVSAVFGALISILARSVPRFTGREYAVRGTAWSAGVIGAVAGVVLGAIGGGILIATGVEAADGGVLLPVRSGLFVILVGGAVLGALTGVVSQLFTVPATEKDEAEEEVRRRLGNAVMVPAVAAIAIVGLVVPLGSLLVTYREFAPLIGIAVAGLILAFAFLMASAPNVRISRGEFLVALAGIGVTLLLIAAVAAQTSGGEDEEGHTQAPIVVV